MTIRKAQQTEKMTDQCLQKKKKEKNPKNILLGLDAGLFYTI